MLSVLEAYGIADFVHGHSILLQHFICFLQFNNLIKSLTDRLVTAFIFCKHRDAHSHFLRQQRYVKLRLIQVFSIMCNTSFKNSSSSGLVIF